MVTLKQIAEKAGVTPAAVSMALRNQKGVSAERRAQILKVAAELGWTHNSHVSSLMRHIRRTRKIPARATLALLIAHPLRDARTQFYFIHRILSGMEQRAHERGYQTDTFWYNDPEMPPQRLCRILHSRGIQGLAIARFRELESVQLDWDSFTLAQVGITPKDPPLHRAVEDYFYNTMMALSRLRASGYRRISLAWPGYVAQASYFLMMGCYARFFEQFPSPDGWQPSCFITMDWSRERFLEWFRKHRPDALVLFRWDVLKWLEEEGVRVPDDVGLAVLNHCPSDPRFAGVDPHPERIGAMSIDLLIDQLECNEIGLPEYPKVITTRGQWRDGQTIRPQVEPLPHDTDFLSDMPR